MIIEIFILSLLFSLLSFANLIIKKWEYRKLLNYELHLKGLIKLSKKEIELAEQICKEYSK